MIKKNINILVEKMNQTKINYDIFLYKPKDDDKKYNQIDEKIDNDIINKIKLLVNGNDISTTGAINENQINIIKQWGKLYELFSFVPKNTYDFIVRMRPDIEILSTSHNLLDIFYSLEKDKIYIPTNLMHDDETIQKYNQFTHINDQFCICNYYIMNEYVNFFNELIKYSNTYPFVSEIMLHQYLKDKNLDIVYIDINYKLNLAKCNIIGIAGDSGAGKSTILESIQKLLIFDNYIKLETDRYHKWERGDENWKIYTHLDPCSNYLEKMNTDMYNLTHKQIALYEQMATERERIWTKVV